MNTKNSKAYNTFKPVKDYFKVRKNFDMQNSMWGFVSWDYYNGRKCRVRYDEKVIKGKRVEFVLSDTFSQYTDMCDPYGREIFENEIVRFSEATPKKCKEMKEMKKGVVKLYKCRWEIWRDADTRRFENGKVYYFGNVANVKVIGNIFDGCFLGLEGFK